MVVINIFVLITIAFYLKTYFLCCTRLLDQNFHYIMCEILNVAFMLIEIFSC